MNPTASGVGPPRAPRNLTGTSRRPPLHLDRNLRLNFEGRVARCATHAAHHSKGELLENPSPAWGVVPANGASHRPNLELPRNCLEVREPRP